MNFRNSCIGIVSVGAIVPAMIVPAFVVSSIMLLFWNTQKRHQRLPLRLPAWTGVKDPSTLEDNLPAIAVASGVEFIGNERKGVTIKGGDELWVSDSDLRTHRLIMGTTGSGKTNTLLSLMLNPLIWGSGFMYADGKAQNTLWADIYAMSSMLWREDDLLIVNYMTGGADPFEEMLNIKRGIKNRRSNTMNPFGKANHNTINQLLSSIMPKASGDSMVWQSKAVNMITGVTQVLCYLRAKKEIAVSVKTLREMMSLPNLIKINQRTDIPDVAIGPIRAYLNVGLPGFSWDLAKAGKPQSQSCMDQHGYMTGQFTRTLGMLSDTYSYIFNDTLPEVDMLDCVLNNRIPVIMIPTLEKSGEEAANLGKIVVSSAKMMMAANLGSEVEGSVQDIIKNRPTNTNVPYEMVLDELGYYFADGIDLMFAQGRSLKIALTASGQDFQAMIKSPDIKNQVESMIANTRIKISLANEDPKETFEVFQKSAGEAYVSEVTGFESDSGALLSQNTYHSKRESQIVERARITLKELKSLAPGDGVLLHKNKVVRTKMFNMFQDMSAKNDMSIKLNTHLPIDKPALSAISGKCKKSEDDRASSIVAMLMAGSPPSYSTDAMSNPVIAAIVAASSKIPSSVPAVERGIALFVAAKQAVIKLRKEAGQPKTSVNTKGRSPEKAFAHDALAFLDDSPLMEVYHDTETKPRKGEDEPVFDESNWAGVATDMSVAVKPRVDPDDNTVFGITVSESAEIDFSPSTKSAISRIIVGLSDGTMSESKVNSEIEVVREMTERACEFTDAGDGIGEPPAAFSNGDDLMKAFSDMEKIISKG